MEGALLDSLWPLGTLRHGARGLAAGRPDAPARPGPERRRPRRVGAHGARPAPLRPLRAHQRLALVLVGAAMARGRRPARAHPPAEPRQPRADAPAGDDGRAHRAGQPLRADARRGARPPPSRRRRHVLLLFDLDGFKNYNDAYGHPAGDALLRRLGDRLAAAVAGRGTAYRMGGDEFCVLAPCAPGRRAGRPDGPRARRARRARRRLRRRLLGRPCAAARRGRRRRRGAADGRPAALRGEAQRPRLRPPAVRRRAAPRARRVGRRARLPRRRRRRAGRRRRPPARASTTTRSSASRPPPSCTTWARSPCRATS